MTHGTQRPGEPDELDRLFTAYFQEQLPKPWPTFQPGPTAEVPTRVQTGRSRATLAVAVAALLGLGWLLSSDTIQPPTGTDPQASGPGLLKDAQARGPDLNKRLNETPEADRDHQSP